LYKERDQEKREQYLHETQSIKSQDIVYIDESGIDHSIIKNNCWAIKGKKVIGNISGTRQRTSVLAALNGNKINAPIRFSGTCNSKLFLYWLEKFLLPTLQKGQTVIMDNASIHKSLKIKELIESAGCFLKYLPPYSPDFNPIEQYWAVMKNNIKKIRGESENIIDAIDKTLQNKKWSF
jgi:transposase